MSVQMSGIRHSPLPTQLNVTLSDMSDKQLKMVAQELRMRECEVRQGFNASSVMAALESPDPLGSAVVRSFSLSEEVCSKPDPIR